MRINCIYRGRVPGACSDGSPSRLDPRRWKKKKKRRCQLPGSALRWRITVCSAHRSADYIWCSMKRNCAQKPNARFASVQCRERAARSRALLTRTETRRSLADAHECHVRKIAHFPGDTHRNALTFSRHIGVPSAQDRTLS